jgi:hypothetical protein
LTSFLQELILISVELTGLFFLAKYHKKLPSPFSIVGKRLESYLNSVLTRYIASMLEEMQEDPETPKMIAAILDKPVRLIVDDLVQHPPAALSKLQSEAGGAVSTGNALVDVAQVVLPMFGKKGKLAAAGLSLLPVLQGKKQSNDSGKHPFDP